MVGDDSPPATRAQIPLPRTESERTAFVGHEAMQRLSERWRTRSCIPRGGWPRSTKTPGLLDLPLARANSCLVLAEMFPDCGDVGVDVPLLHTAATRALRHIDVAFRQTAGPALERVAFVHIPNEGGARTPQVLVGTRSEPRSTRTCNRPSPAAVEKSPKDTRKNSRRRGRQIGAAGARWRLRITSARTERCAACAYPPRERLCRQVI